MATTKITSPDLFDLGSLNTALKLPSGTTAERPTSPSTGEWRYNTTTNLVEYYDGGSWRELVSDDIPPIASENFNTVLYDGNGATNNITGVGFQPDWVWIKERGPAAEQSNIYDSSRGVQKFIVSNSNAAEVAGSANRLNAFGSDGFTVGSDNEINDTGSTYVAWCWKANGGTTASNGEGSVTSTVQANTKGGFSVITWTGTGGVNTVGHGLNSAPELILIKSTSVSGDWQVYAEPIGATKKLILNLNIAESTSTRFNNTSPTSTVFSFNDFGIGTNSDFVTYAFHSIDGYSKIGTYTGNRPNDVIVQTGFEVGFVMIKAVDATDDWFIVDNKRGDNLLYANLTDAESSFTGVSFLSNGFMLNGSANSGGTNNSGTTFLYMAFASDASSAPTLADSFANKLYTGTNAAQSITGLGFQPSFIWFKNRTGTNSHALFDSVRGNLSSIYSDLTSAANISSAGEDLTSFDSDGFSVGTVANAGSTNVSGGSIVAWNWKANTIPTLNTDGTIQSVVSANQAAGFSIVKYTGTSSAATVGHGLSATPEMIIVKKLGATQDWWGYHKDLNGGTNPAYYFIRLNLSDAESLNASSGGSIWNSTAPTSTVFSTGTTLQESSDYIAYCFHSVAGYSKFGSYTGDGTTTKTITTGFQPNFVFIKITDAADNWVILDSARGGSKNLKPNSNAAEATESGTNVEFISTGFKLIGSGPGLGQVNGNGNSYIYMAFKENPTPIVIPAGEMAYMVLAGGASGASNGGGGGAGGLRSSYGSSGGGASAESNITLSAGTYTITIGGGGASIDNSTSYQSIGNAGTATTISGNATVNTVGGGGGGSNTTAAATGGCGGGSGSGSGGSTGAAGTAGEGFAGGNGMASTHPYTGAGGGGTGAVGGGASSSAPGAGGAGASITITGTGVNYGGGGGGTGGTGVGYTGPGGAGGSGGGGAGGAYNGSGTAAGVNTGGGGGATGDAGSFTSGAGGSGIVILRMNTSDYSGTTTGSPTVTTVGYETVLTFTGSGTYVHS